MHQTLLSASMLALQQQCGRHASMCHGSAVAKAWTAFDRPFALVSLSDTRRHAYQVRRAAQPWLTARSLRQVFAMRKPSSYAISFALHPRRYVTPAAAAAVPQHRRVLRWSSCGLRWRH